jgi:uncharacterized protein (DUF1330 family)
VIWRGEAALVRMPQRPRLYLSVQRSVERYGRRFAVRGGRHETLEGDWRPQRIVVLEFPSVERAREWYSSPEYQEIIPLRERHDRTNFLTVVEGV